MKAKTNKWQLEIVNLKNKAKKEQTERAYKGMKNKKRNLETVLVDLPFNNWI